MRATGQKAESMGSAFFFPMLTITESNVISASEFNFDEYRKQLADSIFPVSPKGSKSYCFRASKYGLPIRNHQPGDAASDV